MDFAPSYAFVGAYIQPESSRYYSTDLFSSLSNLLLDSNERNLTPILGGDLNCRFGDLNQAFQEKKLLYNKNVDTTDNYNGRNYGVDLCNACHIFPINHLKYKNKSFDGDYTYYKGNKRSQIDFVFTNFKGLKQIDCFSIIRDNWHTSDHLPIGVELQLPEAVDCSFLIKRAKELNYEFNPHKTQLKRYLATYDEVTFENVLREKYNLIENSCNRKLVQENYEEAFTNLNDEISNVYRVSKVKPNVMNRLTSNAVHQANTDFQNLRKCIAGELEGNVDELLNKYQASRNAISKDVFENEHKRWAEAITENDSKKLWQKIDWKGNMSTKVSQPPVFDDLVLSFEDLYSGNPDELSKIDNLKTEASDPALDDPITQEEMDSALNQMKKGGYDHRIDMFRTIVKVMSPLILLMLNTMFFITYPECLAISLLTAIPKKGDLSLVTNYRGIQMLPALAVLFDRIIANRLVCWLGVHHVQSAFQKAKSTLHQLFTIRLLIEIAKATDTTLYIGLFDLAKAFDKVSRYLLLKKLVVRGISKCMLEALKRLYRCTYCVLSFGKDVSDKFRTWTGIRQGATSSTLLFIGFIDDLVDYLEEHCQPEPILDVLHCLLHADDTAIVSTNRELFVNKCNLMLDYFEANELKLNFSKCEYLIINGKEEDLKIPLDLNYGALKYKSVVRYLGMKISDSGNLMGDIALNLEDKRPNVTIKFSNFCRKNFLAPLDTKLTVLNTCVSASLTYGCEVWGDSKVPKLEAMYRQGLKSALSVRNCVNNEIVYLETGSMPLQVRITQQQLKFWTAISKIMEETPEHYISKLVTIAANCKYVKYYKHLEESYPSTLECKEQLTAEFKTSFENKIRASAGDVDSRLGTYLVVNPSLSKPLFSNKLEFQRVCISRYRTGSHDLKIESGRITGTAREERLCKCNTSIQTLSHVLLHCPMLNDIREKYSVQNVAEGVMKENFLLEMEQKLEVGRTILAGC